MASIDKTINSIQKIKSKIILGITFNETPHGINYYKKLLLNKRINHKINIINVDGYPSNADTTVFNMFLEIDNDTSHIEIGSKISIEI